MPQLLAAGALRDLRFRSQSDAIALGRAQSPGPGLALRADDPEPSVQSPHRRRENLRLAGLQPVDAAAEGDDDEANRLSLGSRRFQRLAYGERARGRDEKVRVFRGHRDL